MLLKILVSNLLKNLPFQIKKNKIKTGLYLSLSIYWITIVFGTIITFQ